ncbi:catechol 2,3-dioxygenase-like lactoylglutathione lyase family enzyme [Deinococcus metalli]|uniref:Catechol 2,3-dioxygenase-like lactoylglutathione lyase family enzyme n=1 Tax=Deinococcus metalli TaxID=1141878 RepID=A0A7W8NLH4_9DEIO|nr:VOC family protein [Deinococcus metalli]MBB5374719.1 catechol 2,3-dioxygenase-like lactoylglutathione lyase family enzyme [Deinococcus metalli]GHF34217.1 hypothetical protein GCM10017781_08800 [Deinococcus metalli]
MHLDHLTLHARDLGAQRDFYAGTLGLNLLEDTPQHVTVQVGASRVTFVHDPAHAAFSHFALDIPRTLVDGAQAWLGARVLLLADADGRTCFGPNARWNTTNVYFDDPAGNIVEFIARHDRPHDHAGFFGPQHVLHLSEYGVVVRDVPAAVRRLGEERGIFPFNGQSDTFTAVGSHDGMLIVVPAGRGWMPDGRPAVPAPFTLAWDGGRTLTAEDTVVAGAPG